MWGVDEEGLAVICVGRLAPEKNLDLLVRTFDGIAARVPGARLIVVGDGPLRVPLQNRRQDFCFAGQRSGEDLARHVASADLFLFPSKTETFGNVVTEALSSAVPVIAFDHAAAAQLIRPDVNGWRVPLEHDQTFIEAAVEAAADRAKLARWATQARESVQALDWDGIVMRFEAALREVLSPQPEERPASNAGTVSSSLLS